MALPSNISYGTVTGAFLRAVADSPVDQDRDPEGLPVPDLSITFTAGFSPSVVRDLSATPPVTILIDPVKATVDSTGTLVGPDGQPGIRLIATDEPDIQPNGWTWSVTIASPTFGTLSFSFALSGGTTVDLATVVQVPANPGTTLAAWLAAVAAAQTAQAAAEAAAALAAAGGGSSTTSAPQFHGARYTAFGHSFGQVQNPVNVWAGSLYPARIRDVLRADPTLYVNRTVSGATMAQIASNASSNWVDGNGGLVTIMGAQNDVILKTAAATFKSGFRSLLTTLLGSTGKPPTVVLIKDTTMTSAGYARYSNVGDADIATYNALLDSVVTEFATGWIVTVDPVASSWAPATMIGPDGQHPNDRGMAFLTQLVVAALKPLAYRPGQNPGVSTPLIASAPSALTITATPGDGQVVIASSGGAGATSYALYRGTSATGSPIATSFPFTDTGRTNGTAVSYVATATNTAGTVTSAVVSTTPTAAAPTGAADNFNRADASSLGSTSTGALAWTDAGSRFGIRSNKAAFVGTADNEYIAYVDDGKSDSTMLLTLSTIVPGSTAAAFRIQDSNNLWIAFADSAGYKLAKKVGGSFTFVTTSAVVPASGDVVRVVTAGSSITVSINGTSTLTATDSTFSTATKKGLWASGTSASSIRFDDFSIA